MSSLLHKLPFLLSKLLQTRRHLCFQRTYDVIIPLYSEYSAPQIRMLGINSVYSIIGIATQSNGYSGLFHLFLFRNKVRTQTHPNALERTQKCIISLQYLVFFFFIVIYRCSERHYDPAKFNNRGEFTCWLSTCS